MIKFKQYLNETINIEKTISQLVDKLKERFKTDRSSMQRSGSPKGVIEAARFVDPTNNKQYTLWILRTYINKGIRYVEDFSRTGEALRIFHKHKQKMSTKDIGQVKSLTQLEDMVEPFKDSLSGKEDSKEYKAKMEKESEILYRSGKDLIVIPKTEEASCFWGRGTKWCTSATDSKNYFNHYNKNGSLYIVIYRGKKYQLHFSTRSYMNDRDNEMSNLTKINLFAWFFTKVNEKVQLTAAKNDPYIIKYIKNPSEKVQLIVVEEDPFLIRYIEKPTEKVKLKAVEDDSYVIQHIENSSEKMQLIAVEEDPFLIIYIENPSEEVQLTAVEEDPSIIQHIKNPTQRVLKLVNDN